MSQLRWGKPVRSFFEDRIQAAGLHRIELGAFEFNANAIKLYQEMRYADPIS